MFASILESIKMRLLLIDCVTQQFLFRLGFSVKISDPGFIPAL